MSFDADAIDALRGLLEIGLQWDAEATEGTASPGPLVSQAFCSALPVAYTAISSAHWGTFAPLVLEAAYEATLWAAASNARRGASPYRPPDVARRRGVRKRRDLDFWRDAPGRSS